MIIALVMTLAVWNYFMLLQGRDSYLRPLETWSVGVDWLICAISIGLPAWRLIQDGQFLAVICSLILAMGLFLAHGYLQREGYTTAK